MKYKNKFLPILIVLFLTVFVYTSGCLELFISEEKTEGTTYTSHATKISYTILYGYDIYIMGNGDYNIKYDCDIPDMINGEILSLDVLDDNYTDVTLVGNSMKSWDVDGTNSQIYKLGMQVSVENEVFQIPDLTGSDALTTNEIKNQYPIVYSNYCNSQTVDNISYINPDDPNIKQTALRIKSQANTDNSFILAKELFKWLKQNNTYQTHSLNLNIQPCNLTYERGSGDCDDLSFLYISLCRSLDIPSRFIKGFLIDVNEQDLVVCEPHAWAEVFVGGDIGLNGWIPVECACSSCDLQAQVYQNFGVEGAGHLRVFTDAGSDESLNVSMSGVRIRYAENIQVDMSPFAYVTGYQVMDSKSLHVNKNSQRSYID